MTKKGLFIAVLLLLCGGGLWFAREDAPKTELRIGARLNELHDFNGEKLKGSYFLLHFWAKWCEPCADEIPHLVAFARSARFTKPLLILAVSLDPTLEEARQILPGQGAGLPENFLLALDPSHRVAESFGSYQYPETYLVDPEGRILEKWIGAQKWESPQVLQYFQGQIR